jgi:hypothetical protein
MTAQKTLRESLEPHPDICYGRDAHCKIIEGIPYDEGVAFLFGGRLTGKTTVFLKVRDSLIQKAAITGNTGFLVVPVYLTPKALSPLDSRGFCKTLLQEAVSICAAQIPGFQWTPLIKDGLTILEFASEMDSLSMAFAGGPEMRSMLVDKISAPRPALIYLENLERPEVEALVRKTTAKTLSKRQAQVIARAAISATGGHPGLLRPLLEEVFISAKTEPGLKAAINKFPRAKQGLFDRIMRGLSPEALCVQDLLCSQNGTGSAQVETTLRAAGFGHHKTPEVLGELRFNGIVNSENGVVSTVGHMYWTYVRQFMTAPAAPAAGGPKSRQASTTAVANLFRKKGECWEIRFAGQETLLPDSEGLGFIHKLLANSNVPFRVTDLSPGVVEDNAPDDQAITSAEYRKLLSEKAVLKQFMEGRPLSQSPSEANRHEEDFEGGVEAEPERDEHCEEEEAETFSTAAASDVTARTPERIAKAKQRLWDIEALLRATTYAGKPKRMHNSSDERARKRVLADVARSLKEIAKKAPKLKEHLWGAKTPKGRRRGALETGWECRYRGDASIPWVV